METFSARGFSALLIRLGAVVVVPTALSGCFLPPMLSLATTSANIITWAATGKTATDHAYSAVARSDCSSLRIFEDKPICIDPPKAGGTAIATDNKDAPVPVVAASNPADTQAVAALGSPPWDGTGPAPINVASAPAAPVATRDIQVASLHETHVAALVHEAPRSSYVAIGSFRDLANAERSQTQFADYHASIVSATVNGQHFNRVVAGPLTEREAAALKNRMTAAANPVRRAG